MYTKHAEFKAGIVVILAGTVLLGLLWLAGGAESLFAKYREVHLRFEQGFAAPVKGDSVYMNGLKVGSISWSEQREEIRTGAQLTAKDREWLKKKQHADEGTVREIYILSAAKMLASQKVPEGTEAEIVVDVTGGRKLSLKPGLSTRDLTDEDTRSHPIPAAVSGSLTDVARAVQDLVVKAGELIDKGTVAIEDVRSLLKSVKEKVDVIDLKGIQANVLDASSSLKDGLATLKTRIDEIGQRIADASLDLRVMAADGKDVVKRAGTDVDAILQTLREVSLDIKGIIDRAGPKVDAILDDTRQAARGAADLGREFTALAPRLHAILGDAGTGIDRVLARFAEVGHNLADASEDLRAHPWKLLNKPDEKEIAYENLRNAASNYVRAAQALGEATDDLKALGARTDLTPEDQKRLVAQALARLQADLAKYGEAEDFFTRMLRAGGGSPAPVK